MATANIGDHLSCFLNSDRCSCTDCTGLDPPLILRNLQVSATYDSKDVPNMNTFCDWLFETIVISVYDSFFRNYISIVLLSFIVCSSQSQRLFI